MKEARKYFFFEKKKQKTFGLLSVALSLLAAPALAQDVSGKDIVLHGNDNGALPCAACHGVNGAGNTSMGAPVLAGLPANMIVQALAQMAQGQGGNEIMQRVAAGLSPAERQAVATYFAGLPKP